MARLFGTDGVRGVAGRELTASLAMEVGAAAAMVLAAETHKKPLVIIGRDTRASGDLLEAAAAAGLCAVGADVLLLGVVPTPAVAYLVQRYHADAGVMLSASHNPYEFNGIKLFGPKGFKLTDAEEDRIEELDERSRLVRLKTSSLTLRVTGYLRLAAMVLGLLAYAFTENLVFGCLFLFAGLEITLEAVVSVAAAVHYEKRV